MTGRDWVLTKRGIVVPTFIEVDLAHLSDNFLAIQWAVASAAVMPIVRANAYGHGLIEGGEPSVGRSRSRRRSRDVLTIFVTGEGPSPFRPVRFAS